MLLPVLALLALGAHSSAAQQSIRIDGLAYSQFGEGTFCLDEASIARDIAQVANYTRKVRIYGCGCASTDAVLDSARRLQLQVLLGVWLNADEQANEQEIAGLQRLLARWGLFGQGLIMGVATGNEVLSVNGGQLVYLLQYIGRIRAIVRPYGIPLTYVDIPEVWLGTHPSMLSTVPDNSTAFTGTAVAFCRPQLSVNVCSLLKRVDWVGVNAHPFYAGVPATCDELNVTGCYNGASWVLGRVRELQRTLGTSDVVVTEVGYPSAGEACCSYAPTGFPANATFMARPSPSNAAVHLTTLTQTLNTAGVTYFYFESFDAAWKVKWSPCMCQVAPHTYLQTCNGTCTYDYNWGLFDHLRRPKAGINMSAYLLPASNMGRVPGEAIAVPGVGNEAASVKPDRWLVLVSSVLAAALLLSSLSLSTVS